MSRRHVEDSSDEEEDCTPLVSPSFLNKARSTPSIRQGAPDRKTSELRSVRKIGGVPLDKIDRELIEFLDEWDQNGDGEYSAEEVLMIAKKFRKKDKQLKTIRRGIIFGTIFTVLLLAAMLVVTLAAIEMSKDTRPNSQGILTTDDGRAAAVARVLRHAELDAIRDLTDEELAELEHVSFDMDEERHNFKVAGSARRAVAQGARPTVDLYFIGAPFTGMTIGKEIKVRRTDGSSVVIDSDTGAGAGRQLQSDAKTGGRRRSVAGLSGGFHKNELTIAGAPWTHIGGKAPWMHITR